MREQEQLEQAIELQESLRGTVDDAIIDATIATLREKLAAHERASHQRKLVTILFMDFAGHTSIVRNLDPEDNMAVIDPALKRLAEVVEAHSGHIARYQGDGFKAVFGLPAAEENDPDNAVRAGLAILAEAKVISSELRTKQGISSFQVRVGIDTGLVLSGGETEGRDTIKGIPVILAARLERAAEPGTLVISHNTYQHVRGAFNLERLEPVATKGFPEPMAAYRVLEEKARSFRTPRHGVEGVVTRMIGRDRELGLLQEIYTEVLGESERQFVTIVGEAGVGKSRILYEFENWVDLESVDVLLYRGRAYLETRHLPYSLLRSIFDFRFGIKDDDQLAVVRKKWIAGFQEGWRQVGQSEKTKIEKRAHILGHLLGVDFSESPHVSSILRDPHQLRNRSVAYLTDYFQVISQSSPVLILLEDLHWADDSSLDVISQFGVRLGEAPVLIACAARPELYERRPYWFEGWDFHRRVNLRALSRRISRGLVSEVLQKVAEVPEELAELIVTHSEGNPFYVEELVKILVEVGVIVKGDQKWWVDEERLAEVEVPSTLTGVLQARLEHLPRDEHTLIQQASVVGRVFWDRAVWYLNQQGEGTLEEDGINNGLAILREREFIYRREQSTFEHALEYIFKHAVLREVTYEGVLKSLRRVYHSLAAEWLMEQRGERTSEVVGLIADHMELSGKQEEALRYLKWAGEGAAVKYANEEAISYFSRALALIPDEKLEMRLELLLGRESVEDLQARRDEQRFDLEAMEKLAKQLGVKDKQLEIGVRWSRFYFATDRYEAAVKRAERVVEEAEAIGNNHQAAHGYLAGAHGLIRLNRGKDARLFLAQALKGFRAAGDRFWEGHTLRILGMQAQLEGDLQAWQGFITQALTIAREIGDKVGEAEAINHQGNLDKDLGNFDSAQILLQQYLNLVREIGSRNQEAYALGNMGEIANYLEDYSAAQVYLEQSVAICQEIGFKLGFGSYQIVLGEALAGLGQWEQAELVFRKALDVLEEINAITIWWAKARIAKTKLRQEGNGLKAKKLADDFLAHLDGGGTLTGTYEPLQTYQSFIKVMVVNEDQRLDDVLKGAYTMLMEQAEKIKDDAMRKSFLENVPWNREILRTWETQKNLN